MTTQPGFFDLNRRYVKLDERDALQHLDALIDWEIFRDTLELVRVKPRKNNAGRKSFDVLMMFKALILQHLHNLGDDELEYQIRDRYSFCRFLGLLPEDRVPDAKTVWLFREELTQQKLLTSLFTDFDLHLKACGYQARKGQIVDATIVPAPIQRNSREENQQIKKGETPERFEHESVGPQKDTDARWTEKNGQSSFGYKNHVCVDVAHKLIRDFEVTSAEVHDSRVFEVLLQDDNTSRDVYADSAYRSEEIELALDVMEYRSHVHTKGKRDCPLTEQQRKANTRKAKIRCRVEHVFGSQENEQGGIFVRVIGLARAATKITLMNLTYNMRRFVYLCG